MFYQSGYGAALQQLGLTKIAVPLKVLTKAGPFLRNLGKDFATNVVGSPRKFYQELKGGTAFGREGLLASGFKAPTIAQKAMMYGFPAVEAISTVAGSGPNKVEALGEIAGGTLMGTAAFGPLGMVGALPADALGRAVGGRAVRGVKRLFGVGNQPVPQYTSLQ